MVDIQNKEVLNALSEDTKITPQLALPRGLKNDIQPVIVANPKKFINWSDETAYTTTQSGATLYTTHATRRSYLTNLIISNQSDANADNTGIIVSIPIQDSTNLIIRIPKITLTAFTGNLSIPFNVPIKLRKGAAITFTNAFAAGVSTTSVVLAGYEVDELEK